MLKALYADPDKCTGCRRCELACAFSKNQAFNPRRAAIQVVAFEPGGIRIPIFCMQCGLCIVACPAKALKRSKAGAIVVDVNKCNGCGLCVASCPYGVIFVDSKTNKAVKCDLCQGDPVCVRYCPQDALRYEDVKAVSRWRQREKARGLSLTSLYRRLWRHRKK